MKKEPVFCYKIKKLIPGGDIEPGLTGLYAGVPDRNYKGRPFRILYGYWKKNEAGEETFIQMEKVVEDWNRAERFRKFMDQWGRGAYTLGYFKMCERIE
jgi:hypothetical protein